MANVAKVKVGNASKKGVFLLALQLAWQATCMASKRSFTQPCAEQVYPTYIKTGGFSKVWILPGPMLYITEVT